MKLNKAILFMLVFCASVSVARATPVDVTTFGAAGDGVADSRAGIQAAIDSVAAAGGGTVYFPAGLYKVTGTLSVPANIRLQGMGSLSNCQLRLTVTGVPLFEVEDGAYNVTFKDLTLFSFNGAGWPRSSPDEVALIRQEGTTGISLKSGGLGISDIVIENVRISQFTRGVSATSSLSRYEAPITNVKIRNYASDGNEYSLYTKSRGANYWDVQNMNVFPMHKDQNGIFLERSGQMSFLQLSCAGGDSGICAKLWDNGNTYFRNMHVEGPRLGFCVGSTNCDSTSGTTGSNNSRITVENSATAGQFHRATNLVSINNRFWLDWVGNPRFEFIGAGANSSVMSCSDVWVSIPYHLTQTTVTAPSGAFPGLATGVNGCVDSYLSSVPTFAQGYTADNEQLSGAVNVVTNHNADPAAGNDDTQAFVAALAAAHATGPQTSGYVPKLRVFVPAGSYDVSSTLQLYGGETFVGEPGSIIRYTGSNGSLFKVVATVGVVKGITWRNLVLTASSSTGTVGIDMESYSATVDGGATDFQIQGVDFNGFEAGISVHPVGGIWTNKHPMFDSISVKDADFSNNKTAILIRSANASNWNLENISVNIPHGEEGVRIDGAGIMSIRGLSCTSSGIGSFCVAVQRQNGLIIEGLSATNVTNALVAQWENGWTQFPFTLRNSDLTAGVYFQGRVYLNSVNNVYPANVNNPSLKVVRFGAYQEGDVNNIAYGGQSDIFSCHDTFTSLLQTQSTWIYTGTLSKPVTYCY
ncbi:MAG: glycosyl hydrolase family 28-related protein [Pyrinomonadaceae bacterium]